MKKNAFEELGNGKKWAQKRKIREREEEGKGRVSEEEIQKTTIFCDYIH